MEIITFRECFILPPPSIPIFPRSFSPFHSSQLACAQFLAPWNPVGEGLRIVSARACPLDLLILLHLNFINFSTGPEDEKNRNSLGLCGFFFHLHYPFVVRSDITPSHLSATRSHTHTQIETPLNSITRWKCLQNGSRVLIPHNPQPQISTLPFQCSYHFICHRTHTCASVNLAAPLADAENEITLFK